MYNEPFFPGVLEWLSSFTQADTSYSPTYPVDLTVSVVWGIQLQRDVTTGWGDAPLVTSSLGLSWSELAMLNIPVDFTYHMLSEIKTDSSFTWDLSDINPVEVNSTLPYDIRAASVINSVANTPVMTWNGQLIRVTEADLSCDHGSPVWIGSVLLADPELFPLMQVGDPVEIDLLGEVYTLVIDGKTQSRTGDGDYSIDCSLSLISPIALLGSPYAADISVYSDAPIMASVAVESVIGPVDWQLTDWLIPAGQFTVPLTNPLDIARRVVGAIGGQIFSKPDGSVVCKPSYPVSPTQYSSTTADVEFYDGDVFNSTSSVAPFDGFNRVQIDNDGESSGSDSTNDSVTFEPYDVLSGTVKGYPSPWRSVDLYHTGSPATNIIPLGIVSRVETETVEFVAGRASVKFPVKSILSSSWNAVDLGSITVDGKNLVASTPGYSLLDIEYVTESYDWFVDGEDGTQVQFVLGDA